MITPGAIVIGASVWFVYELGVGVQVVRGHFKTGQKKPFVPWSVFFADDHQKYLEWKEWKGDRF